MKIITVIIAMLLAAATVRAEDKAKASDKKEQSDKLDIKKLEEKYWSAKDDDTSVVQNRAFTKAKRFYLFGSAGVPMNDAFNQGQVYYTSLGYYFTEKWGMEVSYMSAFMKDNDATDQFIREHKTVPNHNRLKDSTSISGMFVPLYAKMSFLDKQIIYFDMGFSAGFGTTNYEIASDQGDKMNSTSSYHFTVFQHFFFTQHLAMRADFRNMWTTEEKERYRVVGGGDRKLGDTTINDTQLLLGLTFWY
jgi:outer membrane beta-barrel protein